VRKNGTKGSPEEHYEEKRMRKRNHLKIDKPASLLCGAT